MTPLQGSLTRDDPAVGQIPFVPHKDERKIHKTFRADWGHLKKINLPFGQIGERVCTCHVEHQQTGIWIPPKCRSQSSESLLASCIYLHISKCIRNLKLEHKKYMGRRQAYNLESNDSIINGNISRMKVCTNRSLMIPAECFPCKLLE